MGCFEIDKDGFHITIAGGLTLTWDVLKFRGYSRECQCIAINFNMGCFEITFCLTSLLCIRRLTLTWDVLKCNLLRVCDIYRMINFNMGCFEMIIPMMRVLSGYD